MYRPKRGFQITYLMRIGYRTIGDIVLEVIWSSPIDAKCMCCRLCVGGHVTGRTASFVVAEPEGRDAPQGVRWALGSLWRVRA